MIADYLIVAGKEVKVNDEVELLFFRDGNSVISRDDRGIVIVLARSHPFHSDRKRNEAFLKVRIAKIIKKGTFQSSS
ncbi:MAG: hypothetical protein NZ953_04510 [Thaumarchaeota archaeon]|nr:hypothetical protein [Candidatus Calditenuaceae archaeon]